MGLFTTIYRSPPRLGWRAEPTQGYTGFKSARKCSVLTFQLVLWLCIDRTFWEQKRGLFQHFFAKVPERAQLEYEGLWTFTHHEKSVLGHKRRKSRPSVTPLKYLLCKILVYATVEPCWRAKLGADGTCGSLVRDRWQHSRLQPWGQASLFVLNYPLDISAYAGKDT